ncbi:MAG TPA: hypothetical protein VG015_04960, partial [Candidatus Dormibacteraeota bacterium]|nr:hypothetical protein [Candidatus Dormibacteraeota bacterium]
MASLVGVWLSGESCLPMLRPPPAPDRTHLAFYDDFTETGLNLAKWGTCYPWFRGSGCTNQGNA